MTDSSDPSTPAPASRWEELKTGLLATARPTPEQFNLLPGEAKRLAIWVDVARQLRASRYLLIPGTYVGVRRPDVANFCPESSEPLDVLAAVERLQAAGSTPCECVVCGLGSAFLSLVRLGNLRFPTSNLAGPPKKHLLSGVLNDVFIQNHHLLRELFSDEQLLLIEVAFEGRPDSPLDYPDHIARWRERSSELAADVEAAMGWSNWFRDSTKRLQAITVNILLNGGKFVPTQAPPTVEELGFFQIPETNHETNDEQSSHSPAS